MAIGKKKVFLIRFEPKVYSENAHPIGHTPPFMLKYIQAFLLRDNYDISFIDQRINAFSNDEILSLCLEGQFEVVVLQVATIEFESAQYLIGKLRKKNKNVVIIGVGQKITAQYDKIKELNLFDCIVPGEAEEEVYNIINSYYQNFCEHNSVAGFFAKYNYEQHIIVKNLDKLPFVHYDEQEFEKYSFVYPLPLWEKVRWGHVLCTRGCPHGCIFCSQIMRVSYGKELRVRSVENVLNEIENLLNNGSNIISFDDDNLSTSPEYLEKLCAEIIKRKMKFHWICHARVDEMNERLIKRCKQAGCVLLRFGIESGSEKVLKNLRKTKKISKWKQKALSVVKIAKKEGIFVAGLFIVGSPEETWVDLNQSILFAKELNCEIIQVAFFTPFPGSVAYSRYLKKTTIKALEDSLYHYRANSVNISAMSDHDLKRAQIYFYKKYLLRFWFLIQHFIKCAGFYFFNLNVFLRLTNIRKDFFKVLAGK